MSFGLGLDVWDVDLIPNLSSRSLGLFTEYLAVSFSSSQMLEKLSSRFILGVLEELGPAEG